MRTSGVVLGVAGVMMAGGTTGCGIWNPFIPDTRTPVDYARELQAKCSDDAGEGLGPGPVEAVHPLLSTVQSNNDSATHMLGAELHLRPIAALSAEGVQRKLECHEALVVLGRAASMPDDPYVLDGAWLGVRVRSDGDGFVVNVRTDVLDEAKQVYARAQRFAARRDPPGRAGDRAAGVAARDANAGAGTPGGSSAP
jgi:hypothetical protein